MNTVVLIIKAIEQLVTFQFFANFWDNTTTWGLECSIQRYKKNNSIFRLRALELIRDSFKLKQEQKTHHLYSY